jgi:hypothetical protein
MVTGTTEHPATEIQPSPAYPPATAAEPRRRARFVIPRTRGLMSGAILVILGLWGAGSIRCRTGSRGISTGLRSICSA